MNSHTGCSATGRLRYLLTGLMLVSLSLSAAVQAAEPDDGSEALFKEGMQALEEDRLQSAMRAFQSILSQQPSLHRARLELAVAYYRALNYEEARKLAQQVLDDPQTPPQVRVTVLAFLAQIQKDQESFLVRHNFKPSIGLGLMYDSNVNVGPGSEIVEEIPGATLSPGSLERSDTAAVLTAGLAHSYQPGKTYQFGERTAMFLWQSQANLYHRAYNDEDDFDLTVLTASTGPAWVVLRHWRANLALTVDRIWLGGDELAWFASLNPAVTWQFNNGELTLDAAFTDRRYDESSDSGREGTYKATGLSLGHYFMQRKLAGQVGARLLDFQADDDRYGYDGFELLAGVIYKAWTGGSVYARVNHRDVEYDGIEPGGFNVARDETEQRWAAGFQHDFQGGYLEQWSLGGGIQYTQTDSNISFYDYDRRQVMLNLGRTF
ncbi:MAG: tetratricopeptide repeat protein [Gammaproteobacteria bacterium]